MNVRGKSVGESIELVVTCPDDEVTTVPVTVYIDEIEVNKDESHNRDINLDGNLTLRMKYPSLNEFIKNNFDFSTEDEESIEKTFDIIASCIDIILIKKNLESASDCTKKELISWLDGLNSSQFKKIEEFLQLCQKLSHTFTVKNPETGVESEVVLEGLQSFFRLIMAHIDLESYYRINFAMMQHHKYSLTEIENLIPWERKFILDY